MTSAILRREDCFRRQEARRLGTVKSPHVPCNIGYKQTFTAKVAQPRPQTFSARAEAPRLDQELLARIGVEDPEFVAWLQEVDARPLLEAAVGRLRAPGLQLSLDAGGGLVVEGDQRDRARADRILARWTFEVLGVVAEVLGYQATVTDNGVTAQKPGDHAECFTVTREGDLRLRFEHFNSRAELRLEMRRFVAMARRLGIPIEADIDDDDDGGQAGGTLLAQPQ